MKVVCVGDVYITPEMMEKGVKPYLAPDDELEVFFFGETQRDKMRDLIKDIEAGKREEIPVPEGLHEAVKDAEVLIVHLCPVNGDLLEGAPGLKAVMSCRGGKENIDVDAATKLGIAVSNNPAHNANAVAEFTIGLILSETRNITRSDRALHAGVWRTVYPNTKTEIRELTDMTVGIIGFGSIGRLVAEKLSVFGPRILVADPYAVNIPDAVKKVPLEELLAQSDIVTLHARSNGAVLTDREFALMKENAYLINSARSYLVDPQALKRALDSGKLLGVAIDVFETEPEIPSFYLQYDNVTLTNHLGGVTINSFRDAPVFAIKNYLSFKSGGELRFWANANHK